MGIVLIMQTLIALLASAAEASGTDLFTAMAEHRMNCYQKRITEFGLNNPRCHDLARPQGDLIESFRKDFCASPPAFCRRFNLMKLQQDQRLGDFVNSRCETPAYYESTEKFQAGPLSLDDTGDERLVSAIKQAWGCDRDPKVGLSRSKPNQPLAFAQYSCETSKLPFRCDGNFKLTSQRDLPEDDKLSRYIGSLSDANAMLQLMLRGIQLEKAPNGECVMRASVRIGEEFPEKRALARAKANLEGAFIAGANLLDNDATHFNLGARILMPPERIKWVKEQFEIAQKAMQRYLNSIQAPSSVIERVAKTRLIDYSAIWKKHPTARDKEILKELQTVCGKGLNGFGSTNAMNDSDSSLNVHDTEGHHIILCPAAVAEGMLSNASSLMKTTLHELGHSIDLCSIGQTQTGVKNPFDTKGCLKTTPNDGTAAARFESQEFANRMAGFGECLLDNSDMGTGLDVSTGFCKTCLEDEKACAAKSQERAFLCAKWRPTGPQVRSREITEPITALWKFVKRANPSFNDCALKQFARGGALSQCPVSIPKFSAKKFQFKRMTKEQNAKLEELISDINDARDFEEIDAAQESQTDDATADYYAAQALPFAMEDPDFGIKLGDLTPQAKLAEVLVAVADECNLTSHTDENDAHPHDDYRASIYASSERLRKLAGCSQVKPAPSFALPSINCTLAPAKTKEIR